MTYALIHPPQVEPLTLAEVKAHLRLDTAEEDALLAALIRTAREHLERTTGLCLIRQTWRLYLDRWPPNGVILIGKGPVQVIETIVV
ncbi:head-tail connector protein, partial [Rhizobium sp. BR5]